MKKKKKIVIVSINGMKNVGGVERVVFYLHQILSKNYDVRILKACHSFGRFNLLIYPLWFSLKLLFIRNKIVISQSWQSFFYPVDFSIHHGTTKGFTNQCQKSLSLGSKIISWMEKVSAHRAKHILAVSENCKNELIELYKVNESKITVLNNFVDEKQFFPIQKKNSVPGKKITLLFSGRLGNSKGLSELQTLSSYLETIDGVELHIACNDNSNTELFIGKKNTKLHIGLQFNQMNDFYNSGDVLIFPTKYEGFSMATLEALSSGLCIIGTRFAVMPELQKYEFCKVMKTFEPCEVVNVAKKLVSQFSAKKENIHSQIQKDFGTEQYAKKLLSYVEEVN